MLFEMEIDADAIHIRSARPEEADALTQIALAAKRHWGYSEELLTLWKPSLTITSEFVQLGHTFVAVSAHELAGFIGCEPTPPTVVEIVHLWVLPQFMHKGIGRQLWNRAVTLCESHSCSAVELDSDPFARAFYERLGAHHIANTPSIPEGRQLPRLRFEVPVNCG